MEYPSSPYPLTQRLLSDLTEGAISAEEFLDGLTRLQEKLERGYTRLETLRPGDDHPEAQELVDAAAESLRTVYQGLEMLRAVPDSLSEHPDSESIEELDGVELEGGELEGGELEGGDLEGVELEGGELEGGELEGGELEGSRADTEAALELIREGCSTMAELVTMTDQNTDELKGYSGGLLDGLLG